MEGEQIEGNLVSALEALRCRVHLVPPGHAMN